jgi:hypothetical protein
MAISTKTDDLSGSAGSRRSIPVAFCGDDVLQGAVLELDAKKGKVAKCLLVSG